MRVVISELENKLQGYLTNSRVRSRPKCREVPIAKSRGVVYRAFVTEEVYLVEDVEELTTQLHLVAFSY